MLSTSGLVTIQEFQQLEKLRLYQELEEYSERFLREQAGRLKAYSQSWVRDPFHQWSRRWEYPWVAHQLGDLSGGPAKILDAGSGLTFFPFFLVNRNPEWEMHCLDYDPRLVTPFKEINGGPQFHSGHLQNLPFEDQTFDAVYCISVLEHTGDYQRILNEFRRVLKPGGMALITFDVCLNGVAEISPTEAQELVATIQRSFEAKMGTIDFGRQDLLTTAWIKQHLPEALPWRFPFLSAVKGSLKYKTFQPFINLTVVTVRV